jgi:hypothetical protein
MDAQETPVPRSDPLDCQLLQLVDNLNQLNRQIDRLETSVEDLSAFLAPARTGAGHRLAPAQPASPALVDA